MEEKTYEEICAEFDTLLFKNKEINELGVKYIIKNKTIHKSALEKEMGHRKSGRFDRFLNMVIDMGLLKIIKGDRYRVNNKVAEYYEKYKEDERQNKLSKKREKRSERVEKIIFMVIGSAITLVFLLIKRLMS